MRKKAARVTRKVVPRKAAVAEVAVAQKAASLPNSGMMELAYGLAEEQARLYNNIPIPPQGPLKGWGGWKN